MNESIRINDWHNQIDPSREIEERCRQKIVILREGLRSAFKKCDIFISPGISDGHLLSSVRQLVSTPGVAMYVERLDIGWREKYQQLVQQIGMAINSKFDAETDPQEVLDSIEERLNGNGKCPKMNSPDASGRGIKI